MSAGRQAQFLSEGRENLKAAIDGLRGFAKAKGLEEWKGDYNLPISHCFIPGQDTSCGDPIEITEVSAQTKMLTVVCRGCYTNFTVSFSDIDM